MKQSLLRDGPPLHSITNIDFILNETQEKKRQQENNCDENSGLMRMPTAESSLKIRGRKDFGT